MIELAYSQGSIQISILLVKILAPTLKPERAENSDKFKIFDKYVQDLICINKFKHYIAYILHKIFYIHNIIFR